MDDAEYAAADERLSKLPFPGVFGLCQQSGKLILDGGFTAEQIEQILNALRGTDVVLR